MGNTIQGDRLVINTRTAQGNRGRVVAAGLGSVCHGDDFTFLLLADSDTVSVEREDTILIVERQGYRVAKLISLDSDSSRSGLSDKGFHVQLGTIHLDTGSLERWLDTHNHLLLDVEGVPPFTEGIEDVVTVAFTAPTPVHMIGGIIRIVAVDIECVTTPAEPAVIVGAINHGTALDELILEHGSPLVIGVIHGSIVAVVVGSGLELQSCRFLVITEELDSPQDVIAHSATTAGRILHMLLLAYITHQPSHGIGLGSIIGTRVLVQHIVPIKGDGGQRRNIKGITRSRIGIAFDFRGRVGRVFPEIEHHRQRRGRTTRQAGVSIKDAIFVIGRVLVPLGREQRLDLDGPTAIFQGGQLDNQSWMGLQILELLLIGAQPELHIFRHVLHVQRAVAMGKNLVGAVITRYDDKALVVVEDVIHSLVGLRGVHLGVQ